MTKKVKKNKVVISKTITTFKFSRDQFLYNHPSVEKKYIWRGAVQIIYENKEKFKYFRLLYHWNELHEKAKLSRCQVCEKVNKYNFEFKEKRKMFYKKTIKKSNKKFVNIIELVISILSILMEIVSLIISILK